MDDLFSHKLNSNIEINHVCDDMVKVAGVSQCDPHCCRNNCHPRKCKTNLKNRSDLILSRSANNCENSISNYERPGASWENLSSNISCRLSKSSNALMSPYSTEMLINKHFKRTPFNSFNRTFYSTTESFGTERSLSSRESSLAEEYVKSNRENESHSYADISERFAMFESCRSPCLNQNKSNGSPSSFPQSSSLFSFSNSSENENSSKTVNPCNANIDELKINRKQNDAPVLKVDLASTSNNYSLLDEAKIEEWENTLSLKRSKKYKFSKQTFEKRHNKPGMPNFLMSSKRKAKPKR